MRPELEFDRDSAARMYADGATIFEIAEAQGWKRDHMRLRLIEEGIHEAGRIRPVVKSYGHGHPESDYRAAFTMGLDDDQVAQLFGVAVTTVSGLRLKLGFREKKVHPVPKNPFPSVNDDEVLRLSVGPDALSASQIAIRLHCSKRAVERSRNRLRAAGRLESLQVVAKLPPLEGRLRAAEDMLDDGASFAEVARTVHISTKTLNKRFPGRQWTREQIGEYAYATKFMTKRIHEAWPNA